MKKYNLSSIMAAAWKLFRKGMETFDRALRLAWANAKASNAARATAGVTEETHTWAGWKRLGYEVAHGSKALYQAAVIDPATKRGTRKNSYFGFSQVRPVCMEA